MEAQAKYESGAELAPLGIVEITEANLSLMKKQILEIPAMPEDREQYNASREMHIQAKKVLPLIEQRRKEIKAPHLEKCREIDATAKTAKAMIKPIIEMAGDRRGAWEAEIEALKESERKAEQARLDGIMESVEDLKSMITECTAYGIASGDLKGRIFKIASYPMTEEIFQEYLPTAAKIQADGLTSIKQILENRLKYEAEQAELEAQQKAQAEAQAELDAKNKAESDRLAKIAADQEAEAARVKAEQDAAAKKLADDQKKAQAKIDVANAKAKAEQKAKAQKLADEKAAFEADKKAARMALNDSCYTEALSMHRTFAINEFMPSALEMNSEITQARRDAMDARARRNIDLVRDRNTVEVMTRNVSDALGKGYPGVDIPEIKSLVQSFENDVDALIFDLNLAVSEVK